MVVEPALFFHKQEEEATKMNETQHQGATRLRDIQFQVNMDSYTDTLIVIHATVMDILHINA